MKEEEEEEERRAPGGDKEKLMVRKAVGMVGWNFAHPHQLWENVHLFQYFKCTDPDYRLIRFNPRRVRIDWGPPVIKFSEMGCMCGKVDTSHRLSSTSSGDKLQLANGSGVSNLDLEESCIVMDNALWSTLPEHLLDVILAGLPVQSLTRFRSVCKRWESTLLSPSFLKLCSGRKSFEMPWFLFSGPSGECIAHNPNSDKWVPFPLNFLPSFRSVAAASKGLLCVKGDDDRFFVCNPLTRSLVELPPMIIKRENPVMGLVVDENETSFKVIVTSSFYDSRQASDVITEVYDSISGSWKLIDSRLSRFPLQREALSYNGFLYSAGCSTVLVYDVNNEIWSEMDSPVMELLGGKGPKLDTTVLPKICECKGRLLMVAITVNSALVITRVAIWGLDRSYARWKEMEVLPAPMLDEVVRMLPHGYLSNLPQYSGNDDLLCLVIASSRVLVHCISHRTWYWLPPCPFVREFGPKPFAFQPIPIAPI